MEKTYTVNVHIGGTVQVQVSALNEDDAEHLGMTKASQLLRDGKISPYELDTIDAEVLEVVIDIKEVERMLQNLKFKNKEK